MRVLFQQASSQNNALKELLAWFVLRVWQNERHEQKVFRVRYFGSEVFRVSVKTTNVQQQYMHG
jgi:hypothetical protein